VTTQEQMKDGKMKKYQISKYKFQITKVKCKM